MVFPRSLDKNILVHGYKGNYGKEQKPLRIRPFRDLRVQKKWFGLTLKSHAHTNGGFANAVDYG